jgi:hypothetical protein
MSGIRSVHLAGCSKRPSSKAAASEEPEAYPLGYVEDLNEVRTLLAGFFSILLKAIWQAGNMHLELASRHIVDIAAQDVLDHGECDLVPGNGRE